MRAEPPHPSAQLTPLDTDRHRVAALLTNSPRWNGPFLDATRPVREWDQNPEMTGLSKLPFVDFAANQAWHNIPVLAFSLVSWLQLAALPDGRHAKAWDRPQRASRLPAQVSRR